jgi:hypothetical protein
VPVAARGDVLPFWQCVQRSSTDALCDTANEKEAPLQALSCLSVYYLSGQLAA